MPSIPYSYYEEEERRAREAEASQQPAVQPQVQPEQEPQEQSIREATQDVERQEGEQGFFSRLGEAIKDEGDLLNRVDRFLEQNANLTENVPVVGRVNRAAADFVPSREQFDESVADVPVLGQARAAGAGVDAFALTPVTLGARATNQSTEFSQLPAELDDVAGGEIAFEVGRILAPSLMGLPPVSSTGVRIVAESGLETINQRSADDLIMGREASIKLGEIADLLGYDGKALTTKLIEGKEPDAQVMVAVAGFLQNVGVNLAAETIVGKVGKLLLKSKASKGVAEVAERTGKSVDEIQTSLDDITLPEGKGPDYDINEVSTIDTGVPKPTPGDVVVNGDALQVSALRRSSNPGLDNALTASDHSYFTNLDVFSDNASYKKAIDEATKHLEPVMKSSADKARIAANAQAWMKQFIDASNSRFDLDRALEFYPYEMVEPLKPSAQVYDDLARTGGPDKEFLRSGAVTTDEGTVVSTLIGEELGMRLHRAARGVMNLENVEADWSAAIEQYIKLQDKAELFLTPLRRFKLRWNVTGEAQGKDFLRQLKLNLGVDDAKKTRVDRAVDAPADEFRTIRAEPGQDGATLRELLDAYKAGDKDAGNTLKAYFAAISHAPPKLATATMDNLTGVLRAQLKAGNKDATRNLLYASYLTRLAPQTASVVSNLVNLIKEPIGLFLAGERSYAAGQFVGAVSVFSDALQVGKKAFQNGYSVNAGTKLDASVYDTKLRQLKLDNLWEGVQKELQAEGASKKDRVVAWWDYTRQSIANHPLNSVAGRMFLGADEWSKVVYGGMTATGQAFKEMSESGVKRGTAEAEAIVQKNFRNIFTDGVKKGELNPQTGVLDAANAITFSQSIPRGGNVIDQAFRSLQDKGRDSAFWNFVSPFTRVSYWTMEKGGVLLAGSIPGVGGKALMAMVPRYRKIMAGEMGELARLQLKSNFHFAGYSAFMVGGLAYTGFMTGNNPPEGMPKASFIIPTNNNKGYVAVPYGRIEPLATPFAVIADAVQSFRDNVIDEQQYTKLIEDVVIALGLATFDKSFMTGMSNVADLLDVKNFSEGTVVSGTSSVSGVVTSAILPIGAGASLTRMVSSWVNPYETNSKGDPNFFRNIFASIAQRNFGGLTNPARYNPLTGEPLMRVSSLGGKERWKGALASLLNESVVPGQLKDGDAQDIMRELDYVGYDSNRFYTGTRSANGVPLSLELQTHLQRDLYSIGGLPKRLRNFFKSKEYSRLKTELKDARKVRTPEGRLRVEGLEKQLKAKVEKRFADAKQRAVSRGSVGKDERFQQQRRAAEGKSLPPVATQQNNPLAPVLGMYR